MARGWPQGLLKSEYAFYKNKCLENLQEYLGAYEYRDARASGELQAPEGFVAKAPAPTKKNPVLQTAKPSNSGNSGDNSGGDDDNGDNDNNGTVIPVDVDGYWGFVIGKRDMSMYKREKYKEDVELEVGADEAGNPIIKKFKAGEWQDWRSAGTYFAQYENMFRWVKKQMTDAEVKRNGRLDVLVDAIKKSEERIMKTVNPNYKVK